MDSHALRCKAWNDEKYLSTIFTIILYAVSILASRTYVHVRSVPSALVALRINMIMELLMTFAVNHINASLWPYDENRKYRYQPKKIKSRPAEKIQHILPDAFSQHVNIEV